MLIRRTFRIAGRSLAQESWSQGPRTTTSANKRAAREGRREADLTSPILAQSEARRGSGAPAVVPVASSAQKKGGPEGPPRDVGRRRLEREPQRQLQQTREAAGGIDGSEVRRPEG